MVRRLVWSVPRFLLLWWAGLLLFLSALLLLLLWGFIVLPILRPVRARSLPKARHRHGSAHSQRHQPSRELDSRFHVPLHLLILLRRFIRLHWCRQFGERRKIRNHVVVFQHGHLLVDLVDIRRTQRTVRSSRPNPHRRQHQHSRGKRNPRRCREPGPPAFLHSLL